MIVHRRPLRRPPGVGRATGLSQTWERITLAAAVDRELRALDFDPDVVEAPEWRAEGLIVAHRRTAPLVVRLHSAAEQLFPFVKRPGLDIRLSVALERRAVCAIPVPGATPADVLGRADRFAQGRLRLRSRADGLPECRLQRPAIGGRSQRVTTCPALARSFQAS